MEIMDDFIDNDKTNDEYFIRNNSLIISLLHEYFNENLDNKEQIKYRLTEMIVKNNLGTGLINNKLKVLEWFIDKNEREDKYQLLSEILYDKDLIVSLVNKIDTKFILYVIKSLEFKKCIIRSLAVLNVYYRPELNKLKYLNKILNKVLSGEYGVELQIEGMKVITVLFPNFARIYINDLLKVENNNEQIVSEAKKLEKQLS